MIPRRFDVRAGEIPEEGVPLVQPWRRIRIDPEYAGAWVVAGDVDGDGAVEILSARNVDRNDVHHTCSVIVHRLDGSVLWRWGNPAAGRNELHHDVACQIHDWDGDGKNEVIVAADSQLIELDGATGEEKRRLPIPRDASDCIVFADLAGRGRPEEILVKTRYGQIWAYDRAGRMLWTIEAPAGFMTAHQPRPIDIDGDGRDEIMAGYAMLDPDGRVRWDLAGSGLPMAPGHLDCVRVYQPGPTPADFRLVLTCCSAGCIAMIDGEGRPVWSVTGHHFESIDVGRPCPDVPEKQILVDVDHAQWGEGPLWLLDGNGQLLGRIVTDQSRHHLLVDWTGTGADSILAAQAHAMLDGEGRKIAVLDPPAAEGRDPVIASAGNLTGEGRADLLLGTSPGREVCIYRNENGKPPRPARSGTGLNFTLY